MRINVFLLSLLVVIGSNGCGSSGSAGSGGSGGGGGTPSNTPTLNAIAPSDAAVGGIPLTIVAYVSNINGNPSIKWNGKALQTSCVDINLVNVVSCTGATELTANVPAADFAVAGTAQVTISVPNSIGLSENTSNALNFTIAPPPSGTTWSRTVTGISAPHDIGWDAGHGKLYVSIAATDPAHSNTVAVIDPVVGTANAFVPAGDNPNLISISSSSEYLWVGLDGSSTVQRFLLPGLSKDISFPLPLDWSNNPQQAVALQAAPAGDHTMALISGHWGWSPPGDGVYIYDDATARSNHVPGWGANGGPEIDWVQWGADNTALLGNPGYGGGIAKMKVDTLGVTLSSNFDGYFLPSLTPQFDRGTGLLYSGAGAFDPAKLSQMGSFNFPETSYAACTADSALSRYYCVTTYFVGGTTVTAFELWVFDLNSYTMLSRVLFGFNVGGSLPSTISGAPRRLVRWGNAGLAVLTTTDSIAGGGGVFLIDGAAVNPNVTPDSSSGKSNGSYAWLSTMTPDVATMTSGEVQVTIKGRGFSADSTACWSCNSGQMRFLPTTYVSPTQLYVTIPLANVSSIQPLEVSVFDQASSLFSSNALTFTILPASNTTQVTPMNLCGLAMAWDQNSQLLYVATADYDGVYPNSVVAVNPAAGTVVKSQSVESNPAFLSDSANGEYLYVAYDGATNLTQLALPSLKMTVTAPIKTETGNSFIPGDLKAAPQSPHTVAATLITPFLPTEGGGSILVFDDGIPRVNSSLWPGSQSNPAIFDTLAWSASDQLLTTSASSWDDGMTGPLNLVRVDSSGVSKLGAGSAVFNTGGGYLHSDFGTNLIYSDGGSVADPNTAANVGNYGASGLVAPDSSLNRVFILGKTAAQANTNNYTIQSFDQKAFKLVSSITLSNLSGTPISLVRWGGSGLAVLTTGGMADVVENGKGMLYLIQDARFVSSAQAAASSTKMGNDEFDSSERVQQRWKRMTAREILARERQIQTNGHAATLNEAKP